MQYGAGRCDSWCSLHRDITTDIKKFLNDERQWGGIKSSFVAITKLEVRGEGYIDNIRLSKTCHLGNIYSFMPIDDFVVINSFNY